MDSEESSQLDELNLNFPPEVIKAIQEVGLNVKKGYIFVLTLNNSWRLRILALLSP